MTNRQLVLFGYHAVDVHCNSTYGTRAPKVYLINECNVQAVRGEDWIHGRRSDGTEFFTVKDLGLVIVVSDDNIIEVDEDITDVAVPSADWLHKHIKENKILPINMPYYMTWSVWEKTKECLKEKTERAARIKKERSDKLKELGVEETDETLELMRLVSGFDHTYEASDDHRYAIRTRAKRYELEALLEEKCPKLGAYFKSLLLW